MTYMIQRSYFASAADEVPVFSIEGLGIVVFDILVIGAVLYGGYKLWKHVFRIATRDTGIILPNKKVYSVQIGDHLIRYDAGSSFRGIDITLPKPLPHMYLDAHANDNFWSRPSSMYFKTSQRLRLEGNFNKHFQLYVPEGYEVMALSVLTPDVMYVLQTYASEYDIEFYDYRLRLLSNKNIYNKPKREADITKAATKLLAEIDHKLSSWTPTNSKKSLKQHLLVENNPTVKIGSFTMRLSSLVFGVICITFSVPFWLLFYLSYASGIDWIRESKVNHLLAALFFCPGLFFYLVYGYPRGWLKWLGKL